MQDSFTLKTVQNMLTRLSLAILKVKYILQRVYCPPCICYFCSEVWTRHWS